METELHGYKYSVYTWIARFALLEKGVDFSAIEVDPFSDAGHPAHPFGKVPLFLHQGIRIYETSAITRYIDAAFPGRSLQYADAQARALSDQIISILDNYAYWPLVRQVASHGYFRKAMRMDFEPSKLRAGLEASPKILDALEALVKAQSPFNEGCPSLSDIHLGPMMGYFVMAPEGAEVLKTYPALSRWWAVISEQAGFVESKPDLPALP